VLFRSVEPDHNRKSIRRKETLPAGTSSELETAAPPTVFKTDEGAFDSNAENEDILSLAPEPETADTPQYEERSQDESIEIAAGAIKRLTAGILVPNGFTQETQRSMSVLVGNAIGWNIGRGDLVTVHVVPEIAKSADVSRAPQEAGKTEKVAARRRAGEGRAAESKLAQHFESRLALYTILSVLIVVVSGIIIFRVARSTVEPRRLDPAERQQLLADLRRWLKDDVGKAKAEDA
jgi:flagellar biosynthesis/type III secretory pathway M-ring protein FliF/YscJ